MKKLTLFLICTCASAQLVVLSSTNIDAVQVSDPKNMVMGVPQAGIPLPMSYRFTPNATIAHALIGFNPSSTYKVDRSLPGSVTIAVPDATGNNLATDSSGLLSFTTPATQVVPPAPCTHAPTMTLNGEMLVYRNGLLQKVGIDYSLSMAALPTITFLAPISPTDQLSLTLLRSYTLITKVQGQPWTGVGFRLWREDWKCDGLPAAKVVLKKASPKRGKK